MGQIHNEIAGLYHDPDSEESHHALSALCTRLMFLMFCEDAGLIEPGLFRDYVASVDGAHLRSALIELFGWLDTDDEARKAEYPSELLARFPYMNGGLFRERIQIPQLNDQVHYEILVSGCQEFDWSGVDPTVFGSIFEGALSHDTRRSGGMHYTSPENIHKVIDPLFLDGLKEELDDILSKQNPSARTRALRAYHDKLGGLTFLDPACGSGNFLTETYVCLRRLENTVLMELQRGGQSEISFEEAEEESPVKVTLANFHGIEVNDFACCVARTALWIAEKQADINTAKVVKRVYDELPLREYGTIVKANALQLDWNEVVPASECDYIMGNPPFLGHQEMSEAQHADMDNVLDQCKKHGKLDYVAGWYAKAVEYKADGGLRAAFVSTNSICQGEQVSILWDYLFGLGMRISFAHKSFIWNSEATDQAHVHCVIVGFGNDEPVAPTLFSRVGARSVSQINGYLFEGPLQSVASRSKNVNAEYAGTKLVKGSQPTDGQNLLFGREEGEAFLARNPDCVDLLRKYIGADEFIKGNYRYCLWLKDVPPTRYVNNREIMDRLAAVREMRLKSKTASVRRDADTPFLFTQIRQPDTDYLLFPRHSTGRRIYLPIGFVSADVIASDAASFIPNADLYQFGILSSLFHNAWMRVVCGRLKSDYRYSPAVYNSFVFPECGEAQREYISSCAQAVLDAREQAGESLETLYNPDNSIVFPDLMRAHRELDAAVEAAYGVDFNGDEEKIVAHLFKLYAQKTEG